MGESKFYITIMLDMEFFTLPYVKQYFLFLTYIYTFHVELRHEVLFNSDEFSMIHLGS